MRRREISDGLPYRVYERHGLSVYSIGYKGKDNKWVFRLQCDAADKRQITQLRKEATVRALKLTTEENEVATISQLVAAWTARQEKLIDQPKARGSRKKSTLDENKRESAVLCRVFGDMPIVDLEYHHAATYQDTCDEAGRGPKGDKELTLLSVVLNFARRRGIIKVNPLVGLEKLPSRPSERYVTSEELDLALAIGRKLGGSMQITALALKAGYLCVRRSVEVRDLQLQDQCNEGIWWTDGKTAAGKTPKRVLIEWSTELRTTVQEAIDIRPPTWAGPYIFGNQKGNRYVKGGWKANLARLMNACIEEALRRNIPFKKFNLMEMRPKAVTDKIASGQTDAVEATLHTSERMVKTVYDRLRQRKAKPVQ